MNTQVFVPITDDMIYNHPEKIEGPLVPYYAGMECENWLAIEINPDETEHRLDKKQTRKVNHRQSEIKLAYSA